VQEQQVEALDAQPAQALLGGGAQVGGVGVGAAQPGIGEAGKALGADAQAFVEVVPDGADQTVGVAVEASERPADGAVCLALAVGVGGDDRVDPLAGPQQRDEAVVLERLAEAHEPPARPGAEARVAGIAHPRTR
jgi:hypothetical protein